MDKLIATDTRTQTEIGSMFNSDPQILKWAADPTEWEICKAGNYFEEAIADYEANEEEVPVAIAILKPSKLEGQVVYPIYYRNGINVIGEYSGD